MDINRPYSGRRNISRRRHATPTHAAHDRSSRRAIKLFICAGLFVIAVGAKLLFPSALEAVGDKINAVVNYRAALTALGEGLSGEKKFTTALGEAFTYAFTGEIPVDSKQEDMEQATEDEASAETPSAVTPTTGTAASDSAAELDEAEAVFSEDTSAVETDETVAAAEEGSEDSFSNAVIAAFLESQEEYSDYAIPGGVSYEMPLLGIAYEKPVDGEVSSPFGYRIHPTDKVVKFHYGTDIAANTGTPITAFADGKVLAVGDSSTLGKFVILYHGNIESQYAHCDSISVTSGQTVAKGDKIATVGNTGNATDACLHFELKVNGQYVNPEYYIQWI